MFIDIHVHLRKHRGFPREGGKPAYSTPEELLSRYDSMGVEKAVILPGSFTPECKRQAQSEEEVLEICASYPGRFIPFCNIDPRAIGNSPDAPLDEILLYYKNLGCRGIGEVSANIPFLDPLARNLFRHAEKTGLPLTFHIAPQIGGTYGLYDDPGLPQLERSLAEFPGLKFLGHSQAFWAEIARLRTPADRYSYPGYPVAREGAVPELFRRYPNLLGDLSAGSGYNALARDPAYAAEFLDEFQDRLFFGTDICAPVNPAPLADFLLKLEEDGKISREVFRKVARENAVKLLGLRRQERAET